MGGVLEGVLVTLSEHLNANRNQEALQLIDQTLPRHPQGHRLLFGRAIALARLGRAPEARQALQQLPAGDRSNGKVRRLMQELEALN
jgi:Flp pilus assembly protein TadD